MKRHVTSRASSWCPKSKNVDVIGSALNGPEISDTYCVIDVEYLMRNLFFLGLFLLLPRAVFADVRLAVLSFAVWV